jgi:hypothetical protein
MRSSVTSEDVPVLVLMTVCETTGSDRVDQSLILQDERMQRAAGKRMKVFIEEILGTKDLIILDKCNIIERV